ncbi:hypothetical protein [Corynebacterium lowii]|uniref:Uncharacterized protein n=1 Tax=Corynebacterium lowii TaxID=1544413 RepID=A0A0Q0Z9J7_9CORY|nr:hypothetical protein [Corynebacterium lowii]KQB86286.1 hypothetical protein Clow_01205 [Corynebacterium lowii]MDP9850771.1 membrane protein implicated in regulation of membrane protease activity [Corynebacterium lowii]
MQKNDKSVAILLFGGSLMAALAIFMAPMLFSAAAEWQWALFSLFLGAGMASLYIARAWSRELRKPQQ